MTDNTNNIEEDDELLFHDLFVNKTYAKKTLECCGLTINVNLSNSASTDHDLTGQVLWPSALVMTRYIVNNSDQFQSDRKILEVGSGVGVCGLFLARLGKQCILSDYNDIVLDLLKMNRDESTKDGYPCECIKLDWNSQEDIENVKTHSHESNGYDTIIGADVVYWRDSIEPLFKTVNQLLSHHDNSSFILAYQSRSLQTDRYLIDKSIEYGFVHQLISVENIFENKQTEEQPEVKQQQPEEEKEVQQQQIVNTNVEESDKHNDKSSIIIKDEYLLSIIKFIIFKRRKEI